MARTSRLRTRPSGRLIQRGQSNTRTSVGRASVIWAFRMPSPATSMRSPTSRVPCTVARGRLRSMSRTIRRSPTSSPNMRTRWAIQPATSRHTGISRTSIRRSRAASSGTSPTRRSGRRTRAARGSRTAETSATGRTTTTSTATDSSTRFAIRTPAPLRSSTPIRTSAARRSTSPLARSRSATTSSSRRLTTMSASGRRLTRTARKRRRASLTCAA